MSLSEVRGPAAWTARTTVIAVLALAAFLRLFRINFGEYQWDDDGIWSLATNAIQQHLLPAKGINSTLGTGNGPFQVYLMMPAAALSHAPLAGAVAIALLNVAAVFFVYSFVKEFFGSRAGVIAALLFAVNSWTIVYSRHIVAQGMLIPFQVLFFWSAARWLARGHGIDLVLAFLWLAIATQTYLDGLVHLASMAVVLVLGRRWLKPLPLAGGIAVYAAFSANYFLAVIVPERHFLLPAISSPPRIDAASLEFATTQALHLGYEGVAPQLASVLASVSGLERGLLVLEVATYLAGIGVGAWLLVRWARRGELSRAYVCGLLFVWLLVPVLVFVRHQDTLTARHLTLTLPLPAIFSALAIDWLWPRLGAPLAGVLTINSVALAGAFFGVIPDCSTNSVYALPYQQTFDLAASLERVANTSNAQQIYVYGRPSLAPILGSILTRDGARAEWIDTTDSSALALPATRPLQVTLDDDSDVSRALRQGAASPEVFSQAVPCEGLTVRAYAPDPQAFRTRVDALLPIQLALHAPNGPTIERIGADRRLVPGRTLSVGVLLRTGANAAPATLFIHLVDHSGQAVSGSDRAIRSGTDSVEWQRLPVPTDIAPGTYSLELGLYDDRGRRLPLANEARMSAGNAALWGPLAAAPSAPAEAAFVPASVNFGSQIELIGYRASAGELTLQWRALVRPSSDYTVFVHVLDANGRLVAQDDGQPVEGSFPTGTWLPGETVVDRHNVELSQGSYTLQVGLYELATLARLPGGPFEAKLTI